MHAASDRNQVESIKVLKALGANTEAVTKKAQAYSTSPGREMAVLKIRALIESGANLEAIAGPPPYTRPLHFAIELGKIVNNEDS